MTSYEPVRWGILGAADIALKKDAEAVTLVKKNDIWVVKERNDYPANFETIRDFVQKIHEALIFFQRQQTCAASQDLSRQCAQAGPDLNHEILRFDSRLIHDPPRKVLVV